jgi:hypothetical protein
LKSTVKNQGNEIKELKSKYKSLEDTLEMLRTSTDLLTQTIQLTLSTVIKPSVSAPQYIPESEQRETEEEAVIIVDPVSAVEQSEGLSNAAIDNDLTIPTVEKVRDAQVAPVN